MRINVSSGDLLTDRLFAYATETLNDGDLEAATDLLRQTLDRAPTWVPAWALLGEAEERRGERSAALDAYARAAAHDVTGAFGATLHVARLRGDPLDGMPPAYVATLFDQYAPRFDEHLVGTLGYRAPALLTDALARTRGSRRFARALDLGCGTGLMGHAIRHRIDRLEGVDLSPAMIAEAARKGGYDALYVDDGVHRLDNITAGTLDLIVAADVLVYLGALDALFAAAARALAADGTFAFTAQTHAGDGVVLGDDLRYAHSPTILRDGLERAGLVVEMLESASTRRERGSDVPGLVAVACKP